MMPDPFVSSWFFFFVLVDVSFLNLVHFILMQIISRYIVVQHFFMHN